ncbi:MAG: type II secretion system F family protein [Actinobacteria bacterium]|nr:type II secretion system F family protein [Actinomycetota bacterium]
MWFLALTSIFAGATVYLTFLALINNCGRSIEARLKSFVAHVETGQKEPAGDVGLMLGLPLRVGGLLGSFPPIKRISKYLTRWEEPEEVVRLLNAAGLDERISPDDFLCTRLGWAFLMMTATLPGSISFGFFGVLLLAAALLIGLRIPVVTLASLAEGRRGEIKRAMLNAVDLMVVGVGAGMSLDRVMRVYSERFDNALGQEFKRAFTQLDVGKPRREAFLELSDRADVDDLKILISSVLQAEKLGTPLSMILTEQSRDIKTRHRQWARASSAKAPIKMLFPLTGLILPALFIVLLGPIALKLLQGA